MATTLGVESISSPIIVDNVKIDCSRLLSHLRYYYVVLML